MTTLYSSNPLSLHILSVSRHSTQLLHKLNHLWTRLAQKHIYKTRSSRHKLHYDQSPYLVSASCSKKIPVFIEASVLGLAELNNLARTGIYFYIVNLVQSLSRRDDIELLPFSGDYSLLLNTLSASNKLGLNPFLLQDDLVVKFLFFLSLRLSHNPLRRILLLRTILHYSSPCLANIGVKLYHRRIHSLIRIILDSYGYDSSAPSPFPTFRKKLQTPNTSLLKQQKLGALHPIGALVHFTHRSHEWITAPPDLNHVIQRVVTLYDLIPLLHPELCDSNEPTLFKEFLHSFRPTDFVLAISHSTKNDLLDALPYLDKARVFVTPLAASNAFTPNLLHDSLNEGSSTHPSSPPLPSKYILSVATLEPRKNTKLLLESFASAISSLPECEVSLVLVGGKGWVKDDLTIYSKKLGILDSVVFTGYLPDDELPKVYSRALFFVYPSLYEGFGLPVLEAMQCGLPVITSRNSSLAEIASNAALLVDASSHDELSSAIKTLILDSALRDRLRQAGIIRATDYSWTLTASATVEAYKKAFASC